MTKDKCVACGKPVRIYSLIGGLCLKHWERIK